MNRTVTAEVELTREEVEVVLQLVTQGIRDKMNENFGFDDTEWAQVALLARKKIVDMLKLMDAQVDEDA